jgi:hypothetical protein
MSTFVSIHRMTASLVDQPDTPTTRNWLETTLHEVAQDLRRDLEEIPLPDGLWFLPRLELILKCSHASICPDIGAAWSRAVFEALTASLRSPAHWLRYRNEVELLADVVASTSLGLREHEWAWRQAGLLAGGAAEPRATILFSLTTWPHLTVPAITAAAERCGVPALDRALGSTGWLELTALVSPNNSAPVTLTALGHPESHASVPGTTASRAPLTDYTGAPNTAAATDTGAATARTLIHRSPLAALFVNARLRPPHGTIAAWARLVVADAEPALLGVPVAQDIEKNVAWVLAGHLNPTSGQARSPSATPQRSRAWTAEPLTELINDSPLSEGDSRERLPSGTAPTDHTDAERSAPTPAAPGSDADPLPKKVSEPARQAMQDPQPAVLAEPGSDEWAGLTSPWAGLLFLLRTAGSAGLPGRVFDHPALRDKGVRWAIHHAVRALSAVPGDDPALLALSGLGVEEGAALRSEPEPTHTQLSELLRLAHDWRRHTAELLRAAQRPGSPDVDDRALFIELICRRGQICATRGWIRVILPADAADVTVRAAGLDLDPGWVPWLGVVVEYRYE